MGKVVEKFVKEVEAQLAERRVTLSVTDAARSWLAEKGFDPDFGARPLARLIQTELKDRIVDDILFGDLAKGGHVKVDAGEEKLVFESKPS